jgi:predicted secreted Zn-dependent protease
MRNMGLVALAAFILSQLLAVAEAREASRNAYYTVQGRTAKEVYESIRSASPRVAPNATFAFTAIATKTNSRLKEAGGACSYGSFKTHGFYVFTLPKHMSPAQLPTATRANWMSFAAYLEAHEHGHRDIWRQCLADYDGQALGLSASNCKELDLRREKLFNRIKRACVAKDEAYDYAFRKEVRKQPFVIEALQGH